MGQEKYFTLSLKRVSRVTQTHTEAERKSLWKMAACLECSALSTTWVGGCFLTIKQYRERIKCHITILGQTLTPCNDQATTNPRAYFAILLP